MNIQVFMVWFLSFVVTEVWLVIATISVYLFFIWCRYHNFPLRHYYDHSRSHYLTVYASFLVTATMVVWSWLTLTGWHDGVSLQLVRWTNFIFAVLFVLLWQWNSFVLTTTTITVFTVSIYFTSLNFFPTVTTKFLSIYV